MPGYVVAQVQVKDSELYREYQMATIPTIQQYGGTVLAAVPEAETVEGSWPEGVTVIIEFESVEAARRWYDSPEYAGPLGMRHKAATTNMAFVNGLPR